MSDDTRPYAITRDNVYDERDVKKVVPMRDETVEQYRKARFELSSKVSGDLYDADLLEAAIRTGLNHIGEIIEDLENDGLYVET